MRILAWSEHGSVGPGIRRLAAAPRGKAGLGMGGPEASASGRDLGPLSSGSKPRLRWARIGSTSHVMQRIVAAAHGRSSPRRGRDFGGGMSAVEVAAMLCAGRPGATWLRAAWRWLARVGTARGGRDFRSRRDSGPRDAWFGAAARRRWVGKRAAGERVGRRGIGEAWAVGRRLPPRLLPIGDSGWKPRSGLFRLGRDWECKSRPGRAWTERVRHGAVASSDAPRLVRIGWCAEVAAPQIGAVQVSGARAVDWARSAQQGRSHLRMGRDSSARLRSCPGTAERVGTANLAWAAHVTARRAAERSGKGGPIFGWAASRAHPCGASESRTGADGQARVTRGGAGLGGVRQARGGASRATDSTTNKPTGEGGERPRNGRPSTDPAEGVRREAQATESFGTSASSPSSRT